MRERIVCPDCEKVFYEDVEDTRTELKCPLCRHSFVHISTGAFIEYEDETLEVPPHGVSTPSPDSAAKKPIIIDGDPMPGMIFGNYEIIEEIARGATGIVYKARQRNLERIVALKVLMAGETASEEQIKRFHSEAKAVAQLRHPNIVPIYDVDVYKGKHFFAMEYVDGLPLHKAMKKKRLTPNEALDIIVKVAEAIAAAHEAHIIHRDIKPANIMIDKDGRVQVMDFGLAKQIEADTQYTRSGTTMGTPNYMPIEQAQGDVKNINERSDIYSLGAVLYEMLTGVPPYIAETNLKTILKVINEDPIPPRRRNPYIHSDIETICMKAMAKESERRYATVQEFIDDIGRFQAGEPILARPPSTIYHLSKTIRRHRSVIITSLLTIVFSVIVVIAILPLLQRPEVVEPPNNNNNNHQITKKERPGKLDEIHRENWSEQDIADFIAEAAARDAYLPVFAEDLPRDVRKDIRVDMAVQVHQPAGQSARIGYYLYGKQGPGTEEEHLRGYAFVFYFNNGVLDSIEFQRGGRTRGLGWRNLNIKPVNGVVECSIVINQAHTVTPEINGKKLEPYSLKGDVGEHLFFGFGLLMFGDGLSIANDDVVFSEIIPPPDVLLNEAYKEYNDGRFKFAEELYKKFKETYASEVGKPESEGGITMEELIRCRMGIAKAMAQQTGVLRPDVDGSPRVTGIIDDLVKIVEDCRDDDSLVEYAVEAKLWRARLILTGYAGVEADLRSLSRDLSTMTDKTEVQCGADILTGVPVSFSDRILAGISDTEAAFAAQVCETLAATYTGLPSDRALLMLRAGDLLQRTGNWAQAERKYREIATFAEQHPSDADRLDPETAARVRKDLLKTDIAARVRLARHLYDNNSDADAFAEALDDIWNRAVLQADPDSKGTYLFQRDLASAALWLAKLRIEEWKRGGAEKDNLLINAKVEFERILHFVEPDEDAPDAEHDRWVDRSEETIRLLMDIYKIRSAMFSYSVNNILGIARNNFINNRNIPAERCMDMELYCGEILLYFRNYTQARDLFDRFAGSGRRNDDASYFRAIDLIVECMISKGYSNNKNAVEIDFDSLMSKYGKDFCKNIGDRQIKDLEDIKRNLVAKIIMVALLQIVAAPDDERYADYVDSRTRDYRELLDDVIAPGDCIALALGDLGEDGLEKLLKAQFGERPDMSDKLFVDDLPLVREQETDEARTEMIFWLGMRLLSESRASAKDTPQDRERKAALAATSLDYFHEVLRRDVFVNHWYSRFLHLMLREKPYEVPST